MKLPNTTYINRKYNNALTEEDVKYDQLVEEYSDVVKKTKAAREHKLEQLAKHFNTTTDAVLNKLIDTAYDLLPNTVKQPSTNKIKRLTIPITVITLKELITYLSTKYNKHNELVFNLHSYNSIADSMVNLKMYPGNLRDYLKYNYPTAKVTIKD